MLQQINLITDLNRSSCSTHKTSTVKLPVTWAGQILWKLKKSRSKKSLTTVSKKSLHSALNSPNQAKNVPHDNTLNITGTYQPNSSKYPNFKFYSSAYSLIDDSKITPLSTTRNLSKCKDFEFKTVNGHSKGTLLQCILKNKSMKPFLKDVKFVQSVASTKSTNKDVPKQSFDLKTAEGIAEYKKLTQQRLSELGIKVSNSKFFKVQSLTELPEAKNLKKPKNEPRFVCSESKFFKYKYAKNLSREPPGSRSSLRTFSSVDMQLTNSFGLERDDDLLKRRKYFAGM